MAVQEILSVTTTRECVRVEIQGWTHEDPSRYRRGKPIGLSPGPERIYTPRTILEALANGWKLLGPPQPFEQPVYNDNNEQIMETHYSWWLTKDKV